MKTRIVIVNSSSNYHSSLSERLIRYMKEKNGDDFSVFIVALDAPSDEIDRRDVSIQTRFGRIDVPVFSLADYNPATFRKLLSGIAPDLVLMWDDTFLINAALSSLLRRMAIPSLWVQHGWYPSRSQRKRTHASLLGKIKRYRFFLVFYVIYARNRFSFPLVVIKLLFTLFYIESINPRIRIDGYRCDFAGVFDDGFVELAVNKKGYPQGAVSIVGNPDGRNQFSSEVLYSDESSVVLYVPQPLVEFDIVKEDKYQTWAMTLLRSIPKHRTLCIRPHPKSDIELLERMFPGTAFIDRYQSIEVSGVIGHYSTFHILNQYDVRTALVWFEETRDVTYDNSFISSEKFHYSDAEGLSAFLLSRKSNTKKRDPDSASVYRDKDFFKEVTNLIESITT